MLDLIWELVGSEDELQKLLTGNIPEFRVDTVNMMDSERFVRYFDLSILPIDSLHPAHGLLLLLHERSDVYAMQQQAVQDRNELRLLQASLAKANRDLDKLNRLKSVYISMIAHDLRKPLTGINGYAQLLEIALTDNAPDNQRYLAGILDMSRHMDRLIGDILDIDQIERGALKIHPTHFDLRSILSKIEQLFADTLHAKNISFTLRVPDGSLEVFADANRVTQILINLIENATKYTPQNGDIRLNAFHKDTRTVFEVTDTGIGIRQEDLPNLFQLYYRTTQSSDSKITGSGIGLYVVKSLVDLQNGNIDVQSKPGAGTTISIGLPKHPPSNKKTQS